MFIQRKLFTKFSFQLDFNGINVEYANLFSSSKFKVYFDGLQLNAREVTQIPKKWAILSSIFLIWLIYISYSVFFDGNDFDNFIFVLIPCVFCFIMLYVNYFKYIVLDSLPEPLVFMKNSPSKEKIDQFIDEIVKAKLEYDLKTHIPGEVNTVDEIERLHHLYKMKAIDEQEYKDLKNVVLEKEKLKDKFFGTSSIN